MTPYDCRCCGKTERNAYCKDVMDEMLKKQLCFNCNFWDSKIGIKDRPEVARINGEHFVIGREEMVSPYEFRGYGGSKFHIKFHDGREVITTNLWHQGEIPTVFRHMLPNNAEFVT